MLEMQKVLKQNEIFYQTSSLSSQTKEMMQQSLKMPIKKK